jgi:D-alanine--poly(phosphoribitol) ligase subunit 1
MDSLSEVRNLLPPISVDAEKIAYTIFTSGTTGTPKGVEISYRAIAQHVEAMQSFYALKPTDRVAQTSDLSFDIALSNLYMAWSAGASLHIVPDSQIMGPAKFIRDQEITYWFSVPSIIHLMQSMKMLAPGAFPKVRCSIFAGEPLLIKSALAWKEAAPNSVIDNAYGPTEGTVVCVGQRLPPAPPFPQQRDIMGLGKAFPASQIAVVDEKLRFLPADEPGEIALSGLQLATSYFRQPELTARRFPVINKQRWYLTGDKGIRDEQGIVYHLGRLDNQVKMLGHRVELEDIEAHLREVSGSQMVAVVAWPISQGTAQGTVGFVSHSSLSPARIRDLLKERLPSYMVPNQVHIRDIPLSANNKVDRKALVASLRCEHEVASE